MATGVKQPLRQTSNGWRDAVLPAFGVALLALTLCSRMRPLQLLAFHRPLESVAALVGAALLGHLLAGPRGQRMLSWWLDGPDRPFFAALFAAGTALYVAAAWFAFAGVPRLDDGVAAVFQARLFASGHVVLPLPPDAAFYEIFGLLGARADLGHWCGMYPPGWSALLVPGVWLRATWLVNPLLGAALNVTIAVLAADCFGRRTGRLAGVMALFSPFVTVMASLHLSHMATGLFAALALLFLRRWKARGSTGYGAATGLAWGMVLLCRPFDAILVGAVLAVYALPVLGRLRTHGRGLLAAAAAAALCVGLLLAFQAITTGNPLTAGHMIGMGRRGRFGFVRLDAVRTHTVAIGVRYSLARLQYLNERLVGWPVPAFALVLAPWLLRRARREDWLLLAPAFALLTGFACYWYFESFYPARYLFAGLPFLIILAARGVVLLVETARPHPRRTRAAVLFVAWGLVFAAVVALPYQLHRFGPDYGDVESVLGRVMRDYNVHHAVVFMDAKGFNWNLPDEENDMFATGFLHNRPTLDTDVVFVRNLRERNATLIQRYPGRTFYLYRYLRDREKAILFRMIPENGGFRYEPVEPRTPDLVPADPAAVQRRKAATPVS